MKMSIKLSSELLRAARAFAMRTDITLNELVERGIRQLLENEAKHTPFKLRDASVKGNGFNKDFLDASRHHLHQAAYIQTT